MDGGREVRRREAKATTSTFLLPVFFLCLLTGCRSDGATGREAAEPSGEALARTYCASCHRFPAPELLGRKMWKRGVLPEMGRRLGIYEGGERPDSLFEQGVAGRLVKAAGIYPEEPALPREAWRKIVAYYLEHAPEEPLPQPPRDEIETGLETFRVRIPAFRADSPMTSLVAFDSARGRIYVGDVKADFSTLNILGGEGRRLIDRIAPFGAPARVEAAPDGLYLLDMGRLLPTDRPSGRLIKLFKPPGRARYRGFRTLLDSLRRPVDFAFADLSGDGRRDVVVCEFGFRTGGLSWFQNTGGGTYKQHVLRRASGAVEVYVRDLNEDGRPDVIALFGQGDEGIYAFCNEGSGRFSQERLLRFPPSYGSTSFELTDFNGDGSRDILYTAGDNGDYYPAMRPYHGVRIFLGDGRGHFEQAFFYPMNGAYGATAVDFDRDGDLDIAAVSFYPNYARSPQESFVYLENEGDVSFEASTFEESARGRWMVIERGDLGGDGDVDLVLGSFVGLIENSDYLPARRQRRWIREGPSLVILESMTLP